MSLSLTYLNDIGNRDIVPPSTLTSSESRHTTVFVDKVKDTRCENTGSSS